MASSNRNRSDLETFENNDSVIQTLKQQFSKHFDDEIIESVAYECNYNVELSRQNLMDMSGSPGFVTSDTENERQSTTFPQTVKTPPEQRPLRTMKPGNPMTMASISLVSPLDKAIGDARSGNLVLILLRGLPGSGKTTLAKRIVADAVGPCNPNEFIFSTDDFFYKNNVYQYNVTFLGEAHEWNHRRVHAAIQKMHSPLIVDNTNTELWEMKVYSVWAVAKGYIVHVLEANTSWAFNERELARRNTHNVPRQKIREMIDRYQRNVSVERLFKECGIRYGAVKPPQLRRYPPIIINNREDRKFGETEQRWEDIFTSDGCNFSGLPSWFGPEWRSSPGTGRNIEIEIDKVDAATCTTDRDVDGRPRTLSVRNYFVNNGQLPLIYPRVGHYDKGTSTEEQLPDLQTDDVTTCAIDDLQTIFENVPRDFLKDVLDKCHGDVQWSIDLLLEDSKEFLTDYEVKETPIAVVDCVDVDESETKVEIASFGVSNDETKKHLAEQGHALKTHLESNVVINREHYSPHLCKLKGYDTDPGTSTPSVSGRGPIRGNSSDNFVIIDSDMEFDDDDDDDDGDDNDEEIIEIPSDDSPDADMIELNMGERFVEQLNEHFGDADMKLPTGFLPIVEIPKALGRQLHALYLESMFKQMECQEVIIRNMIEEDANFALQLQAEEIRKSEEEQPPDLKQIMKAQAEAQRNQKHAENQWRNLTPDDIAYKMTVQKLIGNFPEVDADTLSEILAAHDRNYDATVNSLRESGAEYRQTVKKTISARTLAEMKAAHEAAGDAMDVEDNPSHVLRAEAVNYQRRRKELLDRAKQYHSKGMYEVAVFYSDLASKQTQLCEKYNHLAAVQIVNENWQRVNNTDTIDLHHLRVPEALNSLDIFVDEIIHNLQTTSGGKNHYFIHVITGRGKNSFNGIPRIRPNVQARLRKRKLRFQLVNPGLLKVKIRKNSAMSAQIA